MTLLVRFRELGTALKCQLHRADIPQNTSDWVALESREGASAVMKSIKELKEIVSRCRAGQPLGDDLSRWLVRSLEEFLTHRTHSVDDAFGLRVPRGGVPWWRQEALRKRDESLRQLASRYYPRLSVSQQARGILQATRRYASSAWRFDRTLEKMPAGYAGTASEFLWKAFKSGAMMPIGERQLRNILSSASVPPASE